MKKTALLFLLSPFFSSLAMAQNEEPTAPMTLEEYQKNYAWRVQQTQLAGQYIPKDLFDAIDQLNKLTDEASRDKFKQLNENDAQHKMFFSLQRWILSNWGLYEGSRLGQYFREVNLTFPEDQATAIVLCWHRSLNKKDLNFKEIRDRFVEKRRKEHEERQKATQTIIVVPAKADTPKTAKAKAN